MEGIYHFSVSGIDGNGHQSMSGMLEPERLDKYGFREGKAFHVGLYHKQQKSELSTFNWVHGGPQNGNVIAMIKDEIIGESEIPALLEKYHLIAETV